MCLTPKRIHNLNNTCFANSVLEAVLSVERFSKGLQYIFSIIGRNVWLNWQVSFGVSPPLYYPSFLVFTCVMLMELGNSYLDTEDLITTCNVKISKELNRFGHCSPCFWYYY